MAQAVKALFFLLCAGSQVSFSCQAMELEEARCASDFINSRSTLQPKELLRSEADGDLRRDSREIKFSSKIPEEKTEPHISIDSSQKGQPEKEKQVVSIGYFLLENVMATFTAEEIHEASSWDRALISHTLARIPKEEERASVFCIAKSYFFGPNIPLEDSAVRSFNFKKIDGFDFCLLLNILTHISEKNWPFFSPPCALPLVGPSQEKNHNTPCFEILPAQDLNDRVLLLKVFSKIPLCKWEILINASQAISFSHKIKSEIEDKALRLITSYQLIRIPEPFRALFFKHIPEAIPESGLTHFLLEINENIFQNVSKMKIFDFQHILEYFIDLSPLKDLSASEMDENFSSKIRDSLDLLEVLCRIPFQELRYIITNTKLLVGDRMDMLGKGNLIETLFSIPREMALKTSNKGDEGKVIATRGRIVAKTLPLITPEMDGRDISDILNTLSGFLMTPEEKDELSPEFEGKMHSFVKFVEKLKDIRKKAGTGRIDSQIIYAASIMPYSKRETFVEDFDKFSPPLQKVSPQEVLHRFLYLSRVPQDHQLKAVYLLNTAVQDMTMEEREEVTKLASAQIRTELKNFTRLVNQLYGVGILYKCLIIKVFFKISSIHRQNFAKRPLEKFFNKSFIPSYEKVSARETYLRSLFLSHVPEDKEKETISILNAAFKDIESHDRESLLQLILSVPMFNLNHFDNLRWALTDQKVDPIKKFSVMRAYLKTNATQQADFIKNIAQKL